MNMKEILANTKTRTILIYKMHG